MKTAVNSNNSNTTSTNGCGLFARYRNMYRGDNPQNSGSRIPHPGDILYWAACLGAACLLILAAT
jgi:hypothetical protein